MANDIKVGDLVMVVLPSACGHCIPPPYETFTVTGFLSGLCWCESCDKCLGDYPGASLENDESESAAELYRLRKIDPLTEPEHIEQPEELTI